METDCGSSERRRVRGSRARSAPQIRSTRLDRHRLAVLGAIAWVLSAVSSACRVPPSNPLGLSTLDVVLIAMFVSVSVLALAFATFVNRGRGMRRSSQTES